MYLQGVSRDEELYGKNNLMTEIVNDHMHSYISSVLINN
jgi:hypothetical protein